MQPSAAVRVNGALSRPFDLCNGKRQGCPLSPLLFILTLEPLLASIRNNLDIKGVKIEEEEYKVAAFAEDILFFVSNRRIILLNIMKVLKEYDEVSNFKINPLKSEILNISKKEEQCLQEKLPFKCQEKKNI